jgi:transposase
MSDRFLIVAERTQLISLMARLKNRTQSILHANLLPRETGRVYGASGRTRLTVHQ